MRIETLSVFPEVFAPYMDASMMGRAQKKDLLDFESYDLRDWTHDRHRTVDDAPFGGGQGMLMKPEPIFEAVRDIASRQEGRPHVIFFSPCGKRFDEDVARRLSHEDRILFVCGHYEGVDQRIIDAFSMEEVSIGDYVLTGGELPAMVLVDAVARLIPGCLSDVQASLEESVYSGLLEHDQYTKPREYEGMQVPEVLFNGNHKLIHLWEYENSLRLTKKRRPDLFKAYLDSHGLLSKDEKKILDSVLLED